MKTIKQPLIKEVVFVFLFFNTKICEIVKNNLYFVWSSKIVTPRYKIFYIAQRAL